MIGGLIVVIISFFSLPLRFLRETVTQLRAVSYAGRVESGETEQLPFTSWLLVAGRIMVSVIALGAVIVLAFMGAAANRDSSILGFLAGLLLGALGAFVFIWVFGLFLEQLSLAAVLVGNTRQMVQLMGGSVPQRPEAAPRAAAAGSGVSAKPTHCPNCHTPLSPSAAFCTDCGTRV